MINLSSFIRFHARNGPDRTAIIYKDERISYADFYQRILSAASLIKEHGISAGDRVALLMRNSPAYLDISFAISHIGAISVPINTRLSLDEIRHVLSDAGASLLFVDNDIFHDCDFGAPRIVLNAEEQGDIRTRGHDDADVPPANCSLNDLYRIMYTSGTTDRPKGVMHSYANFYMKSGEHAVVFDINRETRLLIAGPLCHVGAFDLPGITVLRHGGIICLLRDSDPEKILQAIEQHRLTGAALVPFVTGSLLNHPDREDYDVSSMRWIVGGGERTPEARIREFHDYFVNARYIDCYGLTETCSGDAMMVPGFEITKIGSVGLPTPHVEIEIKDEYGNSVPALAEGEICIRGPKVTPGYWNDEEKTRSSFHGEWLRTGDVGYIDNDGFLFLTDRKKDIIISGGENISSSEVERVIYELPGVLEAVVVGVPDEIWGEHPAAVVVLKSGFSLDFDTLRNHCRERLAHFKVPKELVIRNDLPRTSSNKLMKKKIREDLMTGGV